MLDTEKLVAFAAVTNADRAIRFYRDTLGLQLRSQDGFAVVFEANGVELRLQKVEAMTPQPFTTLGWQVADVRKTVDGLKERGVTCERFPGLEQDSRGVWLAPSGARIAWFKDPDGNVVSVAQYPAG